MRVYVCISMHLYIYIYRSIKKTKDKLIKDWYRCVNLHIFTLAQDHSCKHIFNIFCRIIKYVGLLNKPRLYSSFEL